MARLYDKLDIAVMSPITQKLDAVLKAADFTLLESRQIIGGNNQALYDLMYMNGKEERVFIIAHKPPKG
jgi:hypothetical protein